MGRTSVGGLLTGADTAAAQDKGPALGGIIVIPLINATAGFDGGGAIQDLARVDVPFTYYVCAGSGVNDGTGTAGDNYSADTGTNLIFQRMDVATAQTWQATNEGTGSSTTTPAVTGIAMMARSGLIPTAGGSQTSDELHRFQAREPVSGHALYLNWNGATSGAFPAAFALTAHAFISVCGFVYDADNPTGTLPNDPPYFSTLD